MNNTTVVITGANRGVGFALTKLYLSKKCQVVAVSRQGESNTDLALLSKKYSTLINIKLDITDYAKVSEMAQHFPTDKIDILINNAGYYGPKGYSLGNTDVNEWRKALEVNTIAPLKLTESLLPLIKSATHPKIVMVSSKVGSMTESTSGGGYIYRSSKAALNSVTKSLHNDLSPLGIRCVALHPGWVQTDMGGPNALITAQESAQGLFNVIDTLSPDDSGKLITFDGKTLNW